MGIFEGIMILSDLDGTLLNHGKLSQQHLDAVRYFVENGGCFCPATGRPEGFLFKSFPDLPLKNYCIVKNGTAIYDCTVQKYIWYKPMESRVIEHSIHLLDRFSEIQYVSVHTVDGHFCFKKEEGSIQERLPTVTGEILKMVFEMQGAHEIEMYCQRFDDFQCVCSSDHLFELMAKDTGKGVCVQKLRKMLKDVRCFVGIGDYENDITLLESADIAVAVDGGYRPLREYADWIAPPIEEHPIVWLVEKLKMEIEGGL